MCCNGSACVESLMQISLYNKVCKEMQYIYAVFCFLKLSTYLLTPPRTLKPIFSVIISSILSNWPSILWWTNSLTAEFNISPFATTLWKGNAQLKKIKGRTLVQTASVSIVKSSFSYTTYLLHLLLFYVQIGHIFILCI